MSLRFCSVIGSKEPFILHEDGTRGFHCKYHQTRLEERPLSKKQESQVDWSALSMASTRKMTARSSMESSRVPLELQLDLFFETNDCGVLTLQRAFCIEIKFKTIWVTDCTLHFIIQICSLQVCIRAYYCSEYRAFQDHTIFALVFVKLSLPTPETPRTYLGPLLATLHSSPAPPCLTILQNKKISANECTSQTFPESKLTAQQRSFSSTDYATIQISIQLHSHCMLNPPLSPSTSYKPSFFMRRPISTDKPQRMQLSPENANQYPQPVTRASPTCSITPLQVGCNLELDQEGDLLLSSSTLYSTPPRVSTRAPRSTCTRVPGACEARAHTGTTCTVSTGC